LDFLTSLSIAILHRTCRQDLYFCTACIVLVLQFALCIPHDKTINLTTHIWTASLSLFFNDFALVYDNYQ